MGAAGLTLALAAWPSPSPWSGGGSAISRFSLGVRGILARPAQTGRTRRSVSGRYAEFGMGVSQTGHGCAGGRAGRRPCWQGRVRSSAAESGRGELPGSGEGGSALPLRYFALGKQAYRRPVCKERKKERKAARRGISTFFGRLLERGPGGLPRASGSLTRLRRRGRRVNTGKGPRCE